MAERPETEELLRTGALRLFQELDWEPPARRYRQFRLLEEIGRGGSGIVWRAFDETLSREVAVKLIGMNGASVSDTTLREARIAGKFVHPNIAVVFDAFIEHDTLVVAMPLYTEGTLSSASALGTTRLADPTHRLTFVKQLAEALEEAHSKGVLHLDVKPGNIALSDAIDPILVDFGISRTREGDDWGVGVHWGSLPYLAPELLRGDPPDSSSDIYSFGVTAHELLTGTRPRQHKTDANPERTLDRTSSRVLRLLRQCASPEKEARPESFRSIVRQLEILTKTPKLSRIGIVVSACFLVTASTIYTLSIVPRPDGHALLISTSQTSSRNQTVWFVPEEDFLSPGKGTKTLLGSSPISRVGIPSRAGWLIGVTDEGFAELSVSAFPEGDHYVVDLDVVPIQDARSDMVHVTPLDGELQPFWLDRSEVSNAEYACFVKATGHNAPPSWAGNMPPNGWENLPVTCVSWYDAVAYAAWRGKRLPFHKEWLAALRVSEKSTPVVNRSAPERYSSPGDESFAQAVATYEVSTTAYTGLPGIWHMVGNVVEWTHSGHAAPSVQSGADPEMLRVMAGNAWHQTAGHDVDGTNQFLAPPEMRFVQVGFRCAMSDHPPAQD